MLDHPPTMPRVAVLSSAKKIIPSAATASLQGTHARILSRMETIVQLVQHFWVRLHHTCISICYWEEENNKTVNRMVHMKDENAGEVALVCYAKKTKALLPHPPKGFLFPNIVSSVWDNRSFIAWKPHMDWDTILHIYSILRLPS